MKKTSAASRRDRDTRFLLACQAPDPLAERTTNTWRSGDPTIAGQVYSLPGAAVMRMRKEELRRTVGKAS